MAYFFGLPCPGMARFVERYSAGAYACRRASIRYTGQTLGDAIAVAVAAARRCVPGNVNYGTGRPPRAAVPQANATVQALRTGRYAVARRGRIRRGGRV